VSEHIVNHALVFYVDEAGLQRTAMRGDRIELSAAEASRLGKLGAVVDPGEDAPIPQASVPPPAPPVDPAEAGKLLDEKPAARKPAPKG
jgi:hypothetical protein